MVRLSVSFSDGVLLVPRAPYILYGLASIFGLQLDSKTALEEGPVFLSIMRI